MVRIYRYRDLKGAGVPFTRKHITALEKRDDFPPHFELGENSVAWVADEVDRWVETRVRSRRVYSNAFEQARRGEAAAVMREKRARDHAGERGDAA